MNTLSPRTIHILLALMMLLLAVGVPDGKIAQASSVIPDQPDSSRPTSHARAKATTDRVIVKFKAAAGRAARANLRHDEKLEKLGDLGLIRAENENEQAYSRKVYKR